MADEPRVLLERHGRVGELVLNRPHRRNALTGPLVDAMSEALTTLAADDEVSVILVRGAGGRSALGTTSRSSAPTRLLPGLRARSSGGSTSTIRSSAALSPSSVHWRRRRSAAAPRSPTPATS